MLRAMFKPAADQKDGTPAQHIGKYAVFHHPGYPAGDNELLRLPAVDGDDGGISFRLALHACAILADNRFDGYFTNKPSEITNTPSETTRDSHANPAHRIEPPADDILLPGEYFFHVPAADEEQDPQVYPVTASFDDWQFPHNTLPDCWRSQGSERPDTISHIRAPLAGVARRDGFCRITAHYENVELAHVIPESESTWYASNGMRKYDPQGYHHDVAALGNMDNMLTLRSDLHGLWDKRAFVFMPKGEGRGAFVSHVIEASVELLVHYHNVPSYPLSIRRELLFARFAWAILPRIRSFLIAQQSRTVSIRLSAGQTVAQRLSAEECARLVEQRTRSRSPKKRKVPPGNSSTEGLDEVQADFWPDSEADQSVDSPAADSAYTVESLLDVATTTAKDYMSKTRKRRHSGDRYETAGETKSWSLDEIDRGRKRHR